jgi:hypothetical protein
MPKPGALGDERSSVNEFAFPLDRPCFIERPNVGAFFYVFEKRRKIGVFIFRIDYRPNPTEHILDSLINRLVVNVIAC